MSPREAAGIDATPRRVASRAVAPRRAWRRSRRRVRVELDRARHPRGLRSRRDPHSRSSCRAARRRRLAGVGDLHREPPGTRAVTPLTLTATPDVVDYGGSATLAGELTVDGAGFAGAALAVSSSTDGAIWSDVTIVTTGAAGEYSLVVAPDAAARCDDLPRRLRRRRRRRPGDGRGRRRLARRARRARRTRHRRPRKRLRDIRNAGAAARGRVGGGERSSATDWSRATGYFARQSLRRSPIGTTSLRAIASPCACDRPGRGVWSPRTPTLVTPRARRSPARASG